MKYHQFCESRTKNNALAPDLLSFEIDDERLTRYESKMKELDNIMLYTLDIVSYDSPSKNIQCWRLLDESKRLAKLSHYDVYYNEIHNGFSEFNSKKNSPIYYGDLDNLSYLYIYGLHFYRISPSLDKEAYIVMYNTHYMELTYRYKDVSLRCMFY